MDPVLILLIMQACDYSREVFTLTFVNKLVNKYNIACYLFEKSDIMMQLQKLCST